MWKDPVVLVDYDPTWPQRFERLAARASAALHPISCRVEHVGSTSVPGLPAKPVIDLDVVVAAADVLAAIERLGGIGYLHKGNGGLPGREAFLWPQGEPRHHLYLCTPDTPAFRDHVLFRDYLRAHPEALREYAALKRALAARHAAERDAYQAGKAEFIDAVMERAARTV